MNCPDEMDLQYMNRALALARVAFAQKEVPVGCVIVHEGRIIAEGHNRREQDQNALAHAELIAIANACAVIGYWRLCDCDLYVTLEPCAMCAGAIVNARVRRVAFGARDPKAGAVASKLAVFEAGLNHRPQVSEGILAAESSALLAQFFQALRAR